LFDRQPALINLSSTLTEIFPGSEPANLEIYFVSAESNPNPQILLASEEHLPALAALAGDIWRQHYPGIITSAQIEHMLARMYALATLRDELRRGIEFYRLLVAGRFVGFASLGALPEPGAWKLHKLYLLPAFHGRGLGSRLLAFCETEARRRGAQKLVLAVNKRNAKAITAYERNGFRVAAAVVTDCGGGFVMDDFIMEKALAVAGG